MHTPKGIHFILEITTITNAYLDNVDAIRSIIIGAAEASKATIIESFFHKFSPYGISGVVVIAESHFTVHTWPEHNYLAIDVFTCGELLDPGAAVGYLCLALEVKSIEVKKLYRGLPFSIK